MSEDRERFPDVCNQSLVWPGKTLVTAVINISVKPLIKIGVCRTVVCWAALLYVNVMNCHVYHCLGCYYPGDQEPVGLLGKTNLN